MQPVKSNILLLVALAALSGHSFAQTAPTDIKPASDAKSAAEAKAPTEDKTVVDARSYAEYLAKQDMRLPQVLRAFYLPNGATQNELNDTQTAMRNVLTGGTRIYAMPTDNKIIVAGTAVEIALAQKVMDSLDFSRRTYRLTYTLTELEDGQKVGDQHFSVIVTSGGKTELKQVSKVPIPVGNSADKAGDLQYEEVGLNITASVDGYPDAVRLRSKVEQSTIAEEKSNIGTGAGNPVIRDTSLEGSSILVPGKPLLLGSLDTPGSSRHQEVKVVAEPIQ
jgi:hypothetical protein